jgi:hypothetical protein
VRHTDATYVPARACGIDRLHHRLLGANALHYRIGTNSRRQGAAFTEFRRRDFAALLRERVPV